MLETVTDSFVGKEKLDEIPFEKSTADFEASRGVHVNWLTENTNINQTGMQKKVAQVFKDNNFFSADRSRS